MGMWPLPSAMSQQDQTPPHSCHMSLTSPCCGPTVPGTDDSQAEVAPGSTRASEAA